MRPVKIFVLQLQHILLERGSQMKHLQSLSILEAGAPPSFRVNLMQPLQAQKSHMRRQEDYEMKPLRAVC